MAGASSSSSQSQSQSQSFIPAYEPQLDFLWEFGNDAAGLENEQWKWALGRFAGDTGLTANNINNAYLPAAQNMFDAGMTDMANYDTMYAPELRQLDAERQYYNSDAGQLHEAQIAQDATQQNFTSQRHNLEADLGSYGIDMSANPGKYASQLGAIETREGAAMAAAGQQGFKAAEATGNALTQEELTNLAALPGQSTMDTNVGLQAISGGQNAEMANTSLGALTRGTTLDYLKSGISDVKFQPLGQQSQSSSAQSQQSVSSSAARGGAIPMLVR